MKEDVIHKEVLAWIRAVSPSTLVFHTPNGMNSSPATWKRMEALGAMPGIADLCLVCAAPGPAVAFLEVKGPKGRVSPAQVNFRHLVEGMGIPYAIVRSIDDARAAFKAWMVPTREALT